MTDLISGSTRSIRRRSLAHSAALAVLLIVVSCGGARYAATTPADLI